MLLSKVLLRYDFYKDSVSIETTHPSVSKVCHCAIIQTSEPGQLYSPGQSGTAGLPGLTQQTRGQTEFYVVVIELETAEENRVTEADLCRKEANRGCTPGALCTLLC